MIECTDSMHSLQNTNPPISTMTGTSRCDFLHAPAADHVGVRVFALRFLELPRGLGLARFDFGTVAHCPNMEHCLDQSEARTR